MLLVLEQKRSIIYIITYEVTAPLLKGLTMQADRSSYEETD